MNEISRGGVLPEWLRRRADLSPNHTALICGKDNWTFAELDRRADAAAGVLVQSGVGAGDRVALLGHNSAAFAQIVFATARLGAILVPLNIRLKPSEIEWQLSDCQPACIVTDTPALLESPAGRRQNVPVLSFEDVASAQTAVQTSPDLEVDPGAVRSILYTSGTTGRPKGVMLTHGNFFWSALGSLLQLGHQPEDQWLACLPLFHIGGLSILTRCVINGTTSVIHESFDPDRANRSIDAEGATMISVVPTMLQRMLDSRGDQPFAPNLRCVLLGGGPVSSELTDRCLRLGVPASQTYGLTETTSQIATLRLEEAKLKPGSAGRPLMPAVLRIERDDGSICEPDEAGEIAVSGPTVTTGYFGLQDATAEALRDGWLHSGDAGYIDSDGYLFIIDRRDDLIVSGGENVYPAEVEAALESHPSVLEAGVFAREDPAWGQAVVATVRLVDSAATNEAVLQEHCRETLANFKVPQTVWFADELPRTASGKLLRRDLRSRYAPRQA